MKDSLVDQIKNQRWAGYTVPQILTNYRTMVDYLQDIVKGGAETNMRYSMLVIKAKKILEDIGEASK